MRTGFTLIELMIVIAIIAVIAAIAIPNLLESRISSNEAAAATSLKSGVFPAEVTFQGGNYCDMSGPTGVGDGIGDYAQDFPALAGATTRNINTKSLPTVPLLLLPPTWDVTEPNINNYFYAIGALDERAFCVGCFPMDQGANVGRRCFAISTAGLVYATPPASTNPKSHIGDYATVPFGADYTVLDTAIGWTVYRR